MPDRLEEIKKYDYSFMQRHLNQHTNFDGDRLVEQHNWLISELERLRAENERLHHFVDEVDKLFANVKRERMGKQ